MSECEWASGFCEGLAAWKISLTFDPFHSLAIIRSHSLWHWPWLAWNRSQIVPNRIKPRIIPTLKYFWRFGWQEAKCSYSGVESATCCMFFSVLGYTNELHLSPNWPDVLSNHLQECGLSHATVTMGKSGKTVHISRFGQSLPSCLQNNQNRAAQQSALELSLNSLSKSGSWLLMEYTRRVLVCVSLWWAWHAAVEI